MIFGRWSRAPLLAQINFGHPLAKGLIACHRLNEGAGLKTIDLSRNRRGTITSATWRVGKFGKALDFAGGSADRVDVGTWYPAGTEITISMWIYVDSFNVNRDDRFLSKADGIGTANHDFMVGKTVDGSSNPVLRCRFGRKTNTNISDLIIPTGQWVHVAAACYYNGFNTLSTLYLNGKPQSSPDFNHDVGSPTWNTANSIFIGNQPTATTSAPDGMIRDVLVWDRRLAEAEIKALVSRPDDIFVGPQKVILTTSGGQLLTHSVSDSFSFSDSPVKQPQVVKTDSLTLADTVSKLAAVEKADSFALADAISKESQLAKSDAISLDDALVKAPSKNVSESVAFADATTKSVSKALSDSFALAEALSKSISKSFSESISFTDSTQASIVLVKEVSDSIALADAKVIQIEKALTETISFSDSRIVTVAKNLSDAFILSDSVAKEAQKAFTETISFSDALTKVASKTIADVIALADAKIFLVMKILADSFSLTDSVVASLNGQPEYIAGLLKKPLQARFAVLAYGADIKKQQFEAKFP